MYDISWFTSPVPKTPNRTPHPHFPAYYLSSACVYVYLSTYAGVWTQDLIPGKMELCS